MRRAEVLTQLEDRLAREGFRGRRTLVRGPQGGTPVMDWIGLAFVEGDGEALGLAPAVGVHVAELQRVLYSCVSAPEPRGAVAAISTPLGYLTPANAYRRWVWNPGDSADDFVEEVVTIVLEYGVPYMREHGSLDVLVRALRNSGDAEQPRFKLPILLAMAGQPEAAVDYMSDQLRRLNEGTLVHDQYEAFVECLGARIELGSPP